MAVAAIPAIVGAAGVVGGALLANKGSDDAIKAQEGQNAANQAFIQEQAGRARRDAIPLFRAAQVNRTRGTRGALNALSSAFTPQLEAIGGGSFGAQEALLAGLPQIQNAILGQPVDFSALQAVRLPVDTRGLTNVRPPSFRNPQLGRPDQSLPQGDPNIQAILQSLQGGLR